MNTKTKLALILNFFILISPESCLQYAAIDVINSLIRNVHPSDCKKWSKGEKMNIFISLLSGLKASLRQSDAMDIIYLNMLHNDGNVDKKNQSSSVYSN